MYRFIQSTVFAICLALSTIVMASGDAYKVVLQISDNSIDRQTLVLNVAENLRTEFGDKLELQIVAFGPGLDLMLASNRQAKRLRALHEKGIKLVACKNTADKLRKLGGKDIKLQENVNYTGGGASHIIRLVRDGYVLMRP